MCVIFRNNVHFSQFYLERGLFSGLSEAVDSLSQVVKLRIMFGRERRV